MKFNAKKEATILFLITIFAVIFITSTNSALAQDQASCCVLSTGYCSSESNALSCTSNGGTFKNEPCTGLNECQDICCEYANDECQFQGREVCLVNGGFELNGITTENECIATCNDGFLIQGNVLYVDNEPAIGVIVSFTSGTIQENVTTDSNGNFSIVLLAGTYQVIADANNCDSTPIDFIVDSNEVIPTIILPCSLIEDCISTWTTSDWVPGPNCGHRIATEVAPFCVPPNNKPIEFIPCETTTCGNGIIEAGEDCEFEPLTFPENEGTCEEKFGSNFYGAIDCSYQCQAIDNCIECTGDVNDCTDESMCNMCNECQDAPICKEECLGTEIVRPFTAIAGYRSNQKLIDVSWEMPELCLASTITITRCKANEALTGCYAGSPKPIEGLEPLPGSKTTWTDTDFTLSDAYCYNISVSGTTGFEEFTLGPEKLACAKLWDDRCLEVPNGVHCEGDDLITCELGVVIEDATENCNCACIDETEYDEAYCLGEEGDACSICDICSGPFGLFPYTNYNIKDIYNSDVYQVQFCSDILELKQCYLDDYSRNRAIIGEYKSCSEISTCYDYKTSDSCENNPCSILKIEIDECKWMNLSEQDELGIGVCIPTNIASQDCTMCNTNNVLGNYCPQELCELYGQDEQGKTTCYYNEDLKDEYENTLFDNFTCMNKNHVACETYDSVEKCTGEQKIEFEVNVEYNIENDRVGIDNKYIQLSDDYLQRGKCMWTQESCQRDADGSLVTLDDDLDCSISDDACFLDFENPNTTLYIFNEEILDNNNYSKTELLEISAVVSEDANTYFDITLSSNPINYPVLDKVELNELINTLPTGNLYTLSYYSEDRAKNLEFVQKKNIFLLDGLENIEVVYELFSGYYISSDIYLTNMTVSIDYDDELTCKVNLTDVSGTSGPFIGDGIKTSPALEWNYEYLLDGIYQIETSCIDNHFQTYSNITDVIIDADITMHNASPRGDTLRAGDVPISIETVANATCYYSFDSSAVISQGTTIPNPAIWEEYENTGNKLHTSDVFDDISGIKQIYTSCLMEYENGTTEWYMWNNGDIIYYAIDELAPEISLYDVYAQEIYNSSIIKDFLRLKISCDDYNAVLEAERNYSFGCTNELIIQQFYVNYSNQNQVINIFPQEIITNGGIVDFEMPPYYARIKLNVTVEDMGGNNNTITQFINVRNLSFLEPIAIICDETGICR